MTTNLNSADANELAPLFWPSSTYEYDCVITLKDDKKVHVLKSLLSLHSEYFKAKFANDISRITLDTVDYDAFVNLLAIIYPTLLPITVKNVEAVLKLAHEFKMSGVMKRCEEFWMANSSKFAKTKLLSMAHLLSLEQLLVQCINEFETVDHVKAIQHEPEYATLNDQTKRMILDNIVAASSSSAVSSVSVVPANGNASSDALINQARLAEIEEKLISKYSSRPPNIVLLVGVEKKPIQAHKEFLAFHSEYFDKKFNSDSDEHSKNDVELDAVTYEEVLTLFSVPYFYHPITDENIGTILKLADRYTMKDLVAQCKNMLKACKIKDAQKLLFAQQYRFADLQVEFARQYKSVQDVLNLKVEPEYEQFDDKTRALILDSITQ